VAMDWSVVDCVGCREGWAERRCDGRRLHCRFVIGICQFVLSRRIARKN
jgi:hypothetical protein